MDENKSFWTTEYKITTTQFATLLGLYIKVFVVYTGILGLALKFALDQNSTPKLKLALCVFAFMVCGLLFLSIFIAEKFIKQLQERREKALACLEKKIESEFSIVHWASFCMGLFNSAALVGWIIIFVVLT